MDMTQDLADQLRVLDASDNPQLTATTRAGLDVDREYTLEPLHPAHRGTGLDLIRGVSALGRGRRSGDDVIAMFGIRGEQAVIAQQMHARARHQGGETRDKVQRLEQQVVVDEGLRLVSSSSSMAVS